MSDIAISSRSCTERHGDFSESVVFHSSYEVSCFLFVFWLGCLVFVFVVCLCWLLLGGWMGDTLGFVSLYSHAWEWTISTNRLMTVRASSAHGTGKKKKKLCTQTQCLADLEFSWMIHHYCALLQILRRPGEDGFADSLVSHLDNWDAHLVVYK